MRNEMIRGTTLDQLQEYASLICVILFQLMFTGMALFQSTIAKYRVYVTEDGHQYFHTVGAPILVRLVCVIMMLIVVEVGMWFLLRTLFEASPAPVICPMAILLTISLLYQTYINAPHSSTKHYLTIVLGLITFLVAIPVARLGAIEYLSEKTLTKANTIIWVICGLNVILGLSHKINGSGAFVRIFKASVQPGEILKFALIILAGLSYVQLQQCPRLRRRFIITLIITLITLLIVRDVGNAMILLAVVLMLVYLVYGLQVAATITMLGSAALVVAYNILKKFAADSYIIKRIADVGNALTNPDANENLRRALLAVVRGGLFGKGLENSLYATTNYASSTDFCFVTLVSIFGAGIGVVIIGSYAALILGNRAKLQETRNNAAEYTFCNAMLLLLCIQAIVHIGGNLNLIPMTGVCLPLISTGGTNMLSSMLCLGFISGQYLSSPTTSHLKTGSAKVACWLGRLDRAMEKLSRIRIRK